jgi:hypothetical protein
MTVHLSSVVGIIRTFEFTAIIQVTGKDSLISIDTYFISNFLSLILALPVIACSLRGTKSRHLLRIVETIQMSRLHATLTWQLAIRIKNFFEENELCIGFSSSWETKNFCLT